MSKYHSSQKLSLTKNAKTNIHEDITHFNLSNTNLKNIIPEQKQNILFKNFGGSDYYQKWKHINNLMNKEQKIKKIPQNEFLTHFIFNIQCQHQ